MADSQFATLGVVIDPTGAESGATRALKAMQGLVTQAQQTENAVGGLGKAFQAFSLVMRTVSDTINVIRGAFDTLKGAWSWISGFVDAGAQVERFRVQFGGLLGDYGKADAVLAKLRTYANVSPFQFPQVTEAARQLFSVTSGLQAVGGNVDDVIELLKKVGDATPDPQRLGEVSDSVGRLYVNLRAGVNYDDPARSLAGIGAVSGELATNLQRATAQGKSFRDLWEMVNKDLETHKGNAERLSYTYEGLVSSLSDAYETVRAKLGEPLAIALKAPIQDLTEYITSKQGPAEAFGNAMGEQVRKFYGLWKTGQISAFLIAEYDEATEAFKGYMLSAFMYLEGLADKYLLAPLKSVDFDGAFVKSAKLFGQEIKAEFDEGVSKFRAGMSSAIGDFDMSFSALLTRMFANLPKAVGGGTVVEPASNSYRTYESFLGEYSKGNTPYPKQDFLDPLVKAAGDAAKALLGLTPAVETSKTTLSNFGSLGGSNSISGTGKVFGLNMNGSTDMTDVGRMSLWNAHHGAYRDTDLTDPSLAGAAISPEQASILSGIENTQKAMAAMLGKFIDVTDLKTGKTGSVQVVDIGPGKGVEMTPGGYRSVGGNPGDPLSASMLKGGIDWAAVNKASGVALAPAGAGAIPVKTADNVALELANDTLKRYGITTEEASQANTKYNQTVTSLNELLRQGIITQPEYTSQLSKAQEKLLQSSATYQEIAVSINKAAAEQAKYNRYVQQSNQLAALNNLGTGNSLKFGFQQAAHQQGTDDQQYIKLAGDAYGALGSSFTGMADSFIDNNGRMKESFGQMTADLLKNIAKLITNMLILKAVQTLVGGLTGGGGNDFSGTGGYSQAQYNSDYAFNMAGTGHSGAMIGGWTTGNRLVDPSVFYGAPRHHGGGMLGYDEVPFIGLRGERVLNRRETAAYNRGGGAGGAKISIPITINSAADSGGKDPLSDPTFAKALNKRLRGVAQEEIQKATKYRGALNPG